MADTSKMLAFIGECVDPDKLKSLIKNARKEPGDSGASAVADAAFKKLISIVPGETPGSVEHDFWQTVHAFEFALTEERGRTTRLSRTRQKVARVGVVQTLKDWAMSSAQTDGFRMLLDRGLPELTGEAIILRHSDQFDDAVICAARTRLADVGVDLNKLPSRAS